jgi:hypothetical protein
MRRLNKGAELRRAMADAGLDIAHLAEATQQVDPTGVGLSRSLIGFIVGRGKSARDECSDRAAELLALALGRPQEDLFDTESPSSVVGESTSTPRVQILMSDSPPLPVQLMTSLQLSDFLQKSASWLEKQVQTDPEFPVKYVGRSRRFDPAEVLAYTHKRGEERRAARLAKAS